MSSEIITRIYDISTQYTFYSEISTLIIGLISNIFLILIFVTLPTFRSNQCAFFLMIESIANIGLLLTIFLPNIISYTVGYNPVLTSLICCKLLKMISQGCGLCSLFTICLLTFDQFLSTNPRHDWRQRSTFKLVRRLTFFNVCFVILHSILYLVFAEIRFLECTVFNSALKTYLTYFYFPILSSGLPLIATVTFSLLAYRNVRRIIRRQVPVLRRRLDRQMTAMTLARVVNFILLGLPYIIYSLYLLNLSYTENNQMEVAIADLVGSIVYSLLYINFAINFYIFFIISSRFRRQVKHFLAKTCWNSLRNFRRTVSINGNRNQVAPETVHEIVANVQST